MRTSKHLSLLPAIALVLLAVLLHAQDAQDPQDPQAPPAAWVCEPCNCSEDGTIFESPGKCPACGMTLVDESSVPVVVALLLEGVELPSLAGPISVFARTGRVHTVADTTDPIPTHLLGEIVPQFDFDDVPSPDILIIPSTRSFIDVLDDQLIMNWIAQAGEEASHVIAVGTGGVLLSKSGAVAEPEIVLQGGLASRLTELLEGVTVHSDRALVLQGKVSSARDQGAALDAALNVLAKVKDEATADRTAHEIGVTRMPSDASGSGR